MAVDCKSIEKFIVGSSPTSFILFIFLIMTFFLNELYVIFIFFLLSILIGVAILFASYFLSLSNPDVEKLSAYECGFDPYGDARNAFDVKFYLVGLLFLIFDLETIFFFPWSVGLSFVSFEGFWGMADFIVELLIGYLYIWQVGVLDWE